MRQSRKTRQQWLVTEQRCHAESLTSQACCSGPRTGSGWVISPALLDTLLLAMPMKVSQLNLLLFNCLPPQNIGNNITGTHIETSLTYCIPFSTTSIIGLSEVTVRIRPVSYAEHYRFEPSLSTHYCLSVCSADHLIKIISSLSCYVYKFSAQVIYPRRR